MASEPFVVLLAATAFETQDIVRQLERPVRQSIAGRCVYSGRLEDLEVQLIETGLGAVNTAHALTCCLQTRQPDRVLQIGVGGAYLGGGLGIGDLAVASEEIYGDLGVATAEGWHGAELIGIPVLALGEKVYYNRFELDLEKAQAAVSALRASAWEEPTPLVIAGPFITVQECSGLQILGEQRAARFDAICENMEGAAAAHLCCLYGVPFTEVRAISNKVEDRDRSAWDLPLACGRAQQAAVVLLQEMAKRHQ